MAFAALGPTPSVDLGGDVFGCLVGGFWKDVAGERAPALQVQDIGVMEILLPETVLDGLDVAHQTSQNFSMEAWRFGRIVDA